MADSVNILIGLDIWKETPLGHIYRTPIVLVSTIYKLANVFFSVRHAYSHYI